MTPERMEKLARETASTYGVSIETARGMVRITMMKMALDQGKVEETRAYAASIGMVMA